MAGETEPLLGQGSEDEKWPRRRERVGKALESRIMHILVLLLTAVDAICVLIDLAVDALHPRCSCDEKNVPHETAKPEWLESLSILSFVITTVFLAELPLQVFAFGPRWFWSARHAFFHALDAAVIVVTFILELSLRGAASEVASLLIILRLWRLVKLSSGVAVGVSEAEADERAGDGVAYEEHMAIQRELEEERKRSERMERRLEQLEKGAPRTRAA